MNISRYSLLLNDQNQTLWAKYTIYSPIEKTGLSHLAVDKETLIKKKLQVLQKGELQTLRWLFTLIQDFSNNIMQVAERLQQELVATQQYLRDKHQPAEEQRGRVLKVIKVPSSDEKWEQLRTWCQGRKAEESFEPESSKQLVPFQPSEKGEREAGEAEEYIALQDKPAHPPTVKQIHQTCLAKIRDTLPPGPMSTASGSPA